MPNTNNGTAGNSGNQQEDKPTICKVSKGNLEIDYQARRMILAGRDIRLTDIEFRLLWELVSNEGKAITYAELLTKIWGADYQHEKGYIHTYIRFLRKKIEAEPDNPKHLINIPRVGYRFDCLH
jgi:two-component system KDP operon response regulator KdpE